MLSGKSFLLKGPVSLTTTESSTTPLALIDHLPPEIISYILILSKAYCGYDVAVSAPLCHDAFSEVNVYW